MQRCDIFNGHETTSDYRLYSILEEPFSLKKEVKSNKKRQKRLVRKKQKQINGSSSNLVVISFLFQLSSSFLILLKVVDMFAF